MVISRHACLVMLVPLNDHCSSTGQSHHITFHTYITFHIYASARFASICMQWYQTSILSIRSLGHGRVIACRVHHREAEYTSPDAESPGEYQPPALRLQLASERLTAVNGISAFAIDGWCCEAPYFARAPGGRDLEVGFLPT